MASPMIHSVMYRNVLMRIITLVMCASLLGTSGIGLVFADVQVGGGTYVYLPVIVAPSPPWVPVLTETFEGTFPGNWELLSYQGDTDIIDVTSQYSWGKRNCQVLAGSYSGWAGGGGSTGSSIPCDESYQGNFETWMVYGPMDLGQAKDGRMSINIWSDIELNYDYLKWGISLDNYTFYGRSFSGNSNGWMTDTIDLKNVEGLGNVTGKSQVWVGIWFVTDSANVENEAGVAVDNLVISTCYFSSGCSGTPTSIVSQSADAWKVGQAVGYFR